MIRHKHINQKKLMQQIRTGAIQFAGNARLKIYGRLDCKSGKRMKIETRVFFKTETEAVAAGFRPCGHCLRAQYKEWRAKS